MAVVAGVDFGTLSVRVSIVDSERGSLGSGVAEYPLHRKREDPDYATQSHADHMRALVEAMARALENAGVPGERIEAIALDTTGSSVVPVGEGWSRWTTTTSGAITAPGGRRREITARRTK
jgi:L-ribulokinase